jgi:hypothetical protein
VSHFCCGGAVGTIVKEAILPNIMPQPMDSVEYFTQHPEYLR